VNLAFRFKRVARTFGIVAIFAIVGPVVVSALFMTLMLLIGVQLIQLVLVFVELEALRPWVTIGMALLFFFALVATIPSSVLAGLIFAISAVYFGLNSLWTALAVVGIMIIGVVTLSFFVSPSENSPLLLPSVQGLRQGAWLALFLSVPAAIAASLCWLCSRPLHRMS
jgi:hypothetical protein